MVGEHGSTPLNIMSLNLKMNKNVTIKKRCGVHHNVQCPIVCGCNYWQSAKLNIANDLNHARSTCFSSERILHFILLFHCLFVGFAVVHLKIRQIEIEENSRILSSQIDKVLESVVGHELFKNVQNTKKSLSENTDDILSSKTLSSVHHRVPDTHSAVVSRNKKTMQMPEPYFDPNFLNSRNSNFSMSEVGGDLDVPSRFDLNVSVDSVNSSFPTQDSMFDIMLKKRMHKYILYKRVSPSRMVEKFFSNQVKSNVTNNQWVEHISNYKDRKTELSESVTEGKHLSRVIRSNRRKGKKHKHLSPQIGRNRHCKKSRDCGPLSLHFKGGVPERTFQDGGIIAPWFQDTVMPESFGTVQFELKDGGLLEVLEAGMYLIYAQIYYLTTELHNSFAISIMESGKTQTLLALCSANSCPRGPRSLAEVSCFTSVVRFLNVSDQVFVLQRERNRRILMRDGQSFLGLVKLNSLSQKN